jgi:hypothetical protein
VCVRARVFMCACACMCVRARVCACVCVRVRTRGIHGVDCTKRWMDCSEDRDLAAYFLFTAQAGKKFDVELQQCFGKWIACTVARI